MSADEKCNCIVDLSAKGNRLMYFYFDWCSREFFSGQCYSKHIEIILSAAYTRYTRHDVKD